MAYIHYTGLSCLLRNAIPSCVTTKPNCVRSVQLESVYAPPTRRSQLSSPLTEYHQMLSGMPRMHMVPKIRVLKVNSDILWLVDINMNRGAMPADLLAPSVVGLFRLH